MVTPVLHSYSAELASPDGLAGVLGNPWISLASAISTPLPQPVTPARLVTAIERHAVEDRLILKRLLEDGDPVDILRIHRRSRRATARFLGELAVMFPDQRRHLRRIAQDLDIDLDPP
jgi:hypothetical protein